MNQPDIILSVIKVFSVMAISFFIAVFLTPFLTGILYRHKLWRKVARTHAPDGTETPLFHELHKEREIKTPRMGGLLIWITTLVVAFLLWLLAIVTENSFFDKFNFISRNQTWLPLFTLLTASLLGLVDDLLQVFQRGSYIAGGLSFRIRVLFVVIIALIGGYWFYYRLGVHELLIPGFGLIDIGIWLIPLFVVTMLGTFSTGVIDGLDGLAGGVFASIFAAYAGIAFFQHQIDLAAFSATLLGALLAFLWFNIPPARFYMGETGILGLTTTVTVIAFLTNAVIVLPIIAFIPLLESLSVIVQLVSKKLLKRKIFQIAPLHHHFEVLGWPQYKITMRFWIISFVCAMIGMIIGLIGY